MCLDSVHVSPSIETFSAPYLHIHCVFWTCWWKHSHLWYMHTHCTWVLSLHRLLLASAHSVYNLYPLLTPYLLYVHICWRHAQVLYMPIHCRHILRFYMCIQCRHEHIHCSCEPCTNISYYIYSYCKHKCRLCTYIATVNSCSFTVYVHPLYTQIFCKCLSNVAMCLL